MKDKTGVLLLLVAGSILTLVAAHGCGESDQTSNTAEVSSASLPAGLFLTTTPGEPIPVPQVKSESAMGDEVIVRVVIGGEVNVFLADRAIVKVIDADVENPCLLEDDSCLTPWDYCCTPADELLPHRATIKVVDSQGRTVNTGLKGQGQLAELKTLVVQGIVAEGSDENNLIINARGIFVEN